MSSPGASGVSGSGSPYLPASWNSNEDSTGTFGGQDNTPGSAGIRRGLETAREEQGKGWTAQRVMKIAAIILGISIAAITAVAILINYPTANSVFFTVFGIAAGLSLVALAISGIKYQKSKAE